MQETNLYIAWSRLPSFCATQNIVHKWLPRGPMRAERTTRHDSKTSFKNNARTWHIERGMSLHTMPPRQGVFDCCCQGMSQVKRPCDVWWRNHHDKLFFRRFIHGKLGVARVESLGLPPILPGSFNGTWVIPIRKGDLGKILLFSFGSFVDKFKLWWSNFFLLFGLGLVPSGFFLLGLTLRNLKRRT